MVLLPKGLRSADCTTRLRRRLVRRQQHRRKRERGLADRHPAVPADAARDPRQDRSGRTFARRGPSVDLRIANVRRRFRRYRLVSRRTRQMVDRVGTGAVPDIPPREAKFGKTPSAVAAPERSDYHFQIRTGIFCGGKEAVPAPPHVFTFKDICFCVDEIRALLVPDRQVSHAEEPREIVVSGCPTSWTPGCHAFLVRIYHDLRASIFD